MGTLKGKDYPSGGLVLCLGDGWGGGHAAGGCGSGQSVSNMKTMSLDSESLVYWTLAGVGEVKDGLGLHQAKLGVGSVSSPQKPPLKFKMSIVCTSERSSCSRLLCLFPFCYLGVLRQPHPYSVL